MLARTRVVPRGRWRPSRGRLRLAESGGNVMLVRPFDAVAFARTWADQGLTYAALPQVAADLLTSPGRAPSEGEELLAWMEKNPGAWRA